MAKKLYETLGVAENATKQEIKAAFKQKALQVHPDKSQAEGAEKQALQDKFNEITQAYKTLSDPEKRAEYDKHGDKVTPDDAPVGSPPVRGQLAIEGGEPTEKESKKEGKEDESEEQQEKKPPTEGKGKPTPPKYETSLFAHLMEIMKMGEDIGNDLKAMGKMLWDALKGSDAAKSAEPKKESPAKPEKPAAKENLDAAPRSKAPEPPARSAGLSAPGNSPRIEHIGPREPTAMGGNQELDREYDNATIPTPGPARGMQAEGEGQGLGANETAAPASEATTANEDENDDTPSPSAG